MLVKDGVIDKMFIEPDEPGDPFHVSDADTMLDRHRNIDHILHGFYTVCDQLWMAHQAGTNHVVLYTVTGAADVKVDLVIARLLRQLGASGQVCRSAAAQL